MEARELVKDDATGKPRPTKGRTLKFNNGMMTLTDKDEIAFMDNLISGKDIFPAKKRPIGVKALNAKAANLINQLNEDKETSDAVDDIKKVTSKMRQGAVG